MQLPTILGVILYPRPRALAAAHREGTAASDGGWLALSCLCSDPSRIKKPEVFLLPKDAKKNSTGKVPRTGACGCLHGSKAQRGEGQPSHGRCPNQEHGPVPELQLGGNHSLGGNESLSWDPAGLGPEEAGRVLWAVLGCSWPA